MKFCKNCKYYKSKKLHYELDRCYRPVNKRLSVITGQFIYDELDRDCVDERAGFPFYLITGACGKPARYWEDNSEELIKERLAETVSRPKPPPAPPNRRI